MRISDWSSDVCSSDLYPGRVAAMPGFSPVGADELVDALGIHATWYAGGGEITSQLGAVTAAAAAVRAGLARHVICFRTVYEAAAIARPDEYPMMRSDKEIGRAPSELQSLMRISYAVFCLKKKNTTLKKKSSS